MFPWVRWPVWAGGGPLARDELGLRRREHLRLIFDRSSKFLNFLPVLLRSSVISEVGGVGGGRGRAGHAVALEVGDTAGVRRVPTGPVGRVRAGSVVGWDLGWHDPQRCGGGRRVTGVVRQAVVGDGSARSGWLLRAAPLGRGDGDKAS